MHLMMVSTLDLSSVRLRVSEIINHSCDVKGLLIVAPQAVLAAACPEAHSVSTISTGSYVTTDPEQTSGRVLSD